MVTHVRAEALFLIRDPHSVTCMLPDTGERAPP